MKSKPSIHHTPCPLTDGIPTTYVTDGCAGTLDDLPVDFDTMTNEEMLDAIESLVAADIKAANEPGGAMPRIETFLQSEIDAIKEL